MPTSIVAWTRIGVSELGTMWRRRIVASRTPMERAASMNGRSRSDVAVPRASRAYHGHHEMVRARAACSRPGPSAATIAIASSSGGKARNRSVVRMITASMRPRR